MQRRKKQLLGLAGLALVAVMTVVASGLSAPDVSALENTESEQGVNINVTVMEPGVHVTILNPQDGSTLTSNTLEVDLLLNHVNGASQYLILKKADGTTQRYDLPNIPAGVSGSYKQTFDLATAAGGFGDYEYHISATSVDGQIVEDSVSFRYRAVDASYDGETNEKGDPVVDIVVNDNVYTVQVQLYDEDGNPIYVDANGKETPLILGKDDFDITTGKLSIALPFEEYNLKPGTYTAVIVAFDKDGKWLSMNTIIIKYAPKTPEVPGTGSMLMDNLNISRLDYLLTGLIAFGMVAAFAVYLIYRKSRR